MSYSHSPSPQLSFSPVSLPTTPGVYIYKNGSGKVIYVGKAKNLRQRVSSYFRSQSSLGPKTRKLVENIFSVDHIDVNSEIEALLLESQLIKKFKPPFNIAAKDDTSPYYINLTSEPWPRPQINHESQKSLAGPFLNRQIPRRILRSFRRVAPYCLAHRPVTRPCLYSHLGLCNPCPGLQDASVRPQYLKQIRHLRSLLRGNFARVKSQLKQEMVTLSGKQRFEQAATVRNQLAALKILQQQPISPEEYIVNPNLLADRRQRSLTELHHALLPHYPGLKSLSRIEMYDVAHLSGTAATAAMTVAQNGYLNPKNYRHFKIKFAQTTSDVDMMAEIISRRLKRTDWPKPDLIVLDGGKPQLSSVTRQTSVSHFKLPIIALAKQFETLVLYPKDKFIELQLPQNHSGLLLLMHLRDEAHRFSRRLHHQYRSRTLTSPKPKP